MSPHSHHEPRLDARTIKDAERFAVGFFSSDPGVERVLISDDEEAVRVWTIVNNAEPAMLHRLYGFEGILLDRFPSVPFDFHVIDRQGRPAENLIHGARELITR